MFKIWPNDQSIRMSGQVVVAGIEANDQWKL